MTLPPDPGRPDRPDAPIAYDRAVRLSPRVRRLTQHNPGPFTGPGTNTYLIGDRELVILEPGEEPGERHLAQIVDAVGPATVSLIVPSHGHEDHWTLAPRLAELLGAPIGFLDRRSAFPVDRILSDGEVLAVDGSHLRVLHTPGHTADHVSFVLEEEGALFPGDHVMGWSTSIIAPPEGDLHDYLRSLDRMLALPGLEVAYPAHGETILQPYARIRALKAHREERTRQTLAALASGPSSIMPLVTRIYVDVDPALHPAAAQSLAAHLLALEAEGRVARVTGTEGGPWEQVVWALPAASPG